MITLFPIWRKTGCRGTEDTGLLHRTHCVQGSNAGALNICSRNADGGKWSDLGLGRRADQTCRWMAYRVWERTVLPRSQGSHGERKGRDQLPFLCQSSLWWYHRASPSAAGGSAGTAGRSAWPAMRTAHLTTAERGHTQLPRADVSLTAEEQEGALSSLPWASERRYWPAGSTGSAPPFLQSHSYWLSGLSVGSCVRIEGFFSESLQDMALALQNPKEILETLSCSSSTFKRRKTAHRAC